MTAASLAAYDAILPELPAREAAVLGALLKPRGDGYRGRTNREIAEVLGLERDSVSPRTAKLRQKGLVAEIGTRGPETIYEVVPEPNFVKAPGKRKPKAYYYAIEDAALEAEKPRTMILTKENIEDGMLDDAHPVIRARAQMRSEIAAAIRRLAQ